MLSQLGCDKVLGELKSLASSKDEKEKAIGNLAFFLEATIKNVEEVHQRLRKLEKPDRKQT